MKMRSRLVSGCYLRANLPNGKFVFCRNVEDCLFVYDTFWDLPEIEQIGGTIVVDSCPVMFRIGCVKSLIKGDYFDIVAYKKIPPDDPIIKDIPSVFTQDIMDPEICEIWPPKGGSRPAKPEECIGLEYFSVYLDIDVVERIMCHYEGRLFLKESDFVRLPPRLLQ